MKSVLIGVAAGLLLAVGLAAASSPSGGFPKAHYMVLRITGSGERIFVPDTGARKGYLYIGLPIGSVPPPSPPVASASAATMQKAAGGAMDAGLGAQEARARKCDPGFLLDSTGNCVPESPVKVCTGYLDPQGHCITWGPRAISVVCEPATCNPPGPMPKGDFHFPEEVFANLRIFMATNGIRVESSAR
jgi:hypothetical protein